MIEPDDVPKTLQQAVIYFADLDRCREFMKAVKWPDGKPTCPVCKSENIGEIATRKMLKCNDCDKQFSYTVGTVFEASKISLDKWFVGRSILFDLGHHPPFAFGVVMDATLYRVRANLEDAQSRIREAIAQIGLLPDDERNQSAHTDLINCEATIALVQRRVMEHNAK
jgi:ribosomal protein L37AE/L43A